MMAWPLLAPLLGTGTILIWRYDDDDDNNIAAMLLRRRIRHGKDTNMLVIEE